VGKRNELDALACRHVLARRQEEGAEITMDNQNDEHMNRLRVLLLGPDCHPERVSIPRVTYCHAAALAQLHDVTLVARSSVEGDLKRANAPFHAIEVVRTPVLDRVLAWCFRTIFRSNADNSALTAFRYPLSIVFEWKAWRQLRPRIRACEFDVVLRLLPMSLVLPSPFAFFLRKGPVPFVVGPLQGALPWRSGFSQVKNQKRWHDNLRSLYRYLPFARSTHRHAAAIIAASSNVYSQFLEYREKLFFIPEPGIARFLCCDDTRGPQGNGKLELIFVGGLVPRKACDLALRAAATVLRNGSAHFTVIGDGPEQKRLEELTVSLGIENAVDFCGWITHDEVLNRMRSADVFVFPTLRDNGAGVVFEALASGAVPVVVDFGGPGDIVHPDVGYKVPLTNENDIVSRIEKILADLASDRDLLSRLRKQGMTYARECLTWDAKAQKTTLVLSWAVGRAPKPDLLPPKPLHLERAGVPDVSMIHIDSEVRRRVGPKWEAL
jgi:glycosyltransferase involved in cell wall biosynthesis